MSEENPINPTNPASWHSDKSEEQERVPPAETASPSRPEPSSGGFSPPPPTPPPTPPPPSPPPAPPVSFASSASSSSAGGGAEGKGHQATEKAKELGKKAYDQARDATHNALDAVRMLFVDPIGGQEKALDSLGAAKAFSAGIAFVVAYLLVNLLFGGGTLALVLGGGAAIFSLVPLVFGLFFAAGLFGSIYLIGKLYGKGANVPDSVLTTGVALLPFSAGTILLFVLSKLGLSMLAMLALVFAFAMAVVLVNTSLERVQKVPSRPMILLTPGALALATLAGFIGAKLFS